MKNLAKEDILKMAAANDLAALRLHWEGDDCEASKESAQTILDEIAERVSTGEDEEKLWDIAYICSEEDYQEEQTECGGCSEYD